MSSREEVDAALVDVRHAYRLLYLYQQSVIHLAQQIGNHFGKRFYALATVGEGAPRLTTSPFGVDVWRYLPLYCARFLFLPVDSSQPRSGEWMLEVAAVPDDSLLHNLGGRVDFNSVRSVEDSRSLIGLYGWLAEQNPDTDGWWGVWHPAKWPTDRTVEYPAHLKGAVKVTGARYDFAEMSDPKGLSAKLAEFGQLLSLNGFVCRSVDTQ